MKIYAATLPVNDIPADWYEPYVGQDLWVKCKRTYNSDTGSEYWFRFLDIDYQYADGTTRGNNQIIATYNEVSDWALNNPNDTLYSRARGTADLPKLDTNSGYLSTIIPVIPLQVKSSEELFGLVGHQFENNELNKYVGKNIWVKVVDKASLYDIDDEFYINIDAKQGNTIKYSSIEAYYIEDIETCGDTFGPPSEAIVSNYNTASLDQFALVTPIELLTDEDMQDMLDECDRYWEEHNQEDMDEDDYDDEDEEQ